MLIFGHRSMETVRLDHDMSPALQLKCFMCSRHLSLDILEYSNVRCLLDYSSRSLPFDATVTEGTEIPITV
jgi:hypothetical protein